MSILVTNAKSRVAYAIVRSLGSKGIPVCTADFVSPAIAFSSRYSTDHFLYPSPYSRQQELISFLIRTITEKRIKVMIPVSEETFLFAKYKSALSEHVNMVIADYEQILTMHNKDQWQQVAEKINIPTPRSFSADQQRTDKSLLQQLDFPVLVKPKQGGGAWGIRQFDSREELEKFLEPENYLQHGWDRYFFQEKISGEAICVAMLFCRGASRARTTYKQLRDYPTTGGQATLRVSLRHEQAEDYFRKLLEKMAWHGICQADFIIDNRTQTPYLIDINPRFFGSLIQALASGVDFPYLLYKIAVDGDVKVCNDFMTGITTRWLSGEVRAFPHYLRQADNKLRFLSHFFGGTGAALYDDFELRDPLPFFTWWADAIKKIIVQRTLRPSSHESLQGVWK